MTDEERATSTVDRAFQKCRERSMPESQVRREMMHVKRIWDSLRDCLILESTQSLRAVRRETLEALPCECAIPALSIAFPGGVESVPKCQRCRALAEAGDDG